MFASRRLALVTSVAVLSVGAFAAVRADAEPAPAPASSTAPTASSESGSVEVVATADEPSADDMLVIDEMIDDSWIEEYNAEARELADHLSALGIANTLHTEEDGWLWVEWNYEDTAAQTAVEDFYWAKYPIPQAEIDDLNAQTDELVVYLRAHGVDVTVTTDRHGIESAEWDYEDAAAQNAIDDFYWEKYPMSQDEIDQINADTQALVDFLIAKGFTATVTTDRHGISTPDFEYTDAIGEALAEFYESLPFDDGGSIVIADSAAAGIDTLG